MSNLTNMSNEYDALKLFQEIGKNYFGSDVSQDRLGTFGYVTETMAHIFGALSLDSTMRSREFCTATATKRSTLMATASKFGIKVPAASPAGISIYLGVDEEDIFTYGTLISNEPKIYKFVIEKATTIQIGEYVFMPEFDIEITATYSESSDSYTYKARYLTTGNTDYTSDPEYKYPEANVFSDVSQNTIQCYRIQKNDIKIVVAIIEAQQLTKITTDYVVSDTTTISLSNEDFAYTNQLVYFNIYYKESDEYDWKLVKTLPIYENNDIDEDVVYYERKDDDNILTLSFADFKPKFNSTFRVDIYTTIGEEVNDLVYTGTGSDIKVTENSIDDRHGYAGVTLSCWPISTNKTGCNNFTIDELRAYIISNVPLLNALITNSDIEKYINNESGDNEYIIRKVRSDILDMIHRVEVKLRYGDEIIPSRTIPEAQVGNTVSDVYEPGEVIAENYTSPYAYGIINNKVTAFENNINTKAIMAEVETNESFNTKFRIDHISIIRDLNSNIYKITVNVWPDGDISKAINSNIINTGIVANTIMLKGFLYTEQEKHKLSGIVNFKFVSYSNGIFTFECDLDTLSSIESNELMISVSNSYRSERIDYESGSVIVTGNPGSNYLSGNGEIYNTDGIQINYKGFMMEIGCYYLNYPASISSSKFSSVKYPRVSVKEIESGVYNVNTISGVFSHNYPLYTGVCEYSGNIYNIDYTLCDIYSNLSDTICLYIDRSNMINISADVIDSTSGISSNGTMLPLNCDWSAMASGNTSVVGVGNKNYSFVYESGSSEVQNYIVSSTERYWQDICFTGTKFIAIANNSNIAALSDNGKIWSEVYVPFVAPWNVLESGSINNTVYAVALATDSNVAIFTKNHGTSWSNVNIPISRHWSNIAFGGGTFIVIASNSRDCVYTRNPESSSAWIQKNISSSNKEWSDIAYGNGVFVAIAKNSNQCSYSSDGGDTWRESFISANIRNWTNIVYTSGMFAMITEDGQYIATSTNGSVWQERTLNVGKTITVYDSTFLGNILICGDNNSIAKLDTIETSGGYQECQITSLSSTWVGPIFNGSNYYIASSTGDVYSSSSGQTWDKVSTVSGTYTDFKYLKDKFILISTTGIKYSSDGIIWQSKTFSQFITYKDVCFDGNEFVFLGLGAGDKVYLAHGTDLSQSLTVTDTNLTGAASTVAVAWYTDRFFISIGTTMKYSRSSGIMTLWDEFALDSSVVRMESSADNVIAALSSGKVARFNVTTEGSYWFTIEPNDEDWGDVSSERIDDLTGTSTYRISNSRLYINDIFITATPAQYYEFLRWKVNGDDVSEGDSGSFNGNGSAIAVFGPKPQYTITFSAGTGGSVSTQGGSYYKGVTATCTATASSNYTFVRWYKNGSTPQTVSTNTVLSFEALGSGEYIAEFAPSATATVEIRVNTTNSAAKRSLTGAGTYNVGDAVTLTATANTGYHFVKWKKSSDASYEGSTATITFTASVSDTYTAYFDADTPTTYAVSVVSSNTTRGSVSQSSVSGLSGNTTVSISSATCTIGSTTITATANTGYAFDCWMRNGERLSSGSSFTINGVDTITAQFSLVTYQISYHYDSDVVVTGVFPSSYNIESNTIIIPQTITKPSTSSAHYAFDGWYSESTYTNKVTQITNGSHGNVDLYVKWETISISKLPYPTPTLDISGSYDRIKWSSITNASAYEVYVNGTKSGNNITDTGSNISIDLRNYASSAGTYVFTFKTLSSDTTQWQNSDIGGSITYILRSVDSTTNIVSCTVTGAPNVICSARSFSVTFTPVSGASFDSDPYCTNASGNVISGSGYKTLNITNITGNVVLYCTCYTQLDTPTNIQLSEVSSQQYLTWDAVSHANNYTISISDELYSYSDVELTSNTNQCEITSILSRYPTNYKLTACVKAVADSTEYYSDSEWSSDFNIVSSVQLPTPSFSINGNGTITLNYGYVSGTDIDGIDVYLGLVVMERLQSNVNGVYTYNLLNCPYISSPNTYTIKLKAIAGTVGGSNRYIDSEIAEQSFAYPIPITGLYGSVVNKVATWGGATPTDGIDAYELFEIIDDGFNFTLISVLANGSSSYDLSSLTSVGTHNIYIRARAISSDYVGTGYINIGSFTNDETTYAFFDTLDLEYIEDQGENFTFVDGDGNEYIGMEETNGVLRYIGTPSVDVYSTANGWVDDAYKLINMTSPAGLFQEWIEGNANVGGFLYHDVTVNIIGSGRVTIDGEEYGDGDTFTVNHAHICNLVATGISDDFEKWQIYIPSEGLYDWSMNAFRVDESGIVITGIFRSYIDVGASSRIFGSVSYSGEGYDITGESCSITFGDFAGNVYHSISEDNGSLYFGSTEVFDGTSWVDDDYTKIIIRSGESIERMWHNWLTDNSSNAYTVSIETNYNYGSISNDILHWVPDGSSITVNGNTIEIDGVVTTATPSTGYTFSRWSIPDNSSEVTDNIAITAIFDPISYTVTLSVSDPDHSDINGESEIELSVPYGTTALVSYSGHSTITLQGTTYGLNTVSGYISDGWSSDGAYLNPGYVVINGPMSIVGVVSMCQAYVSLVTTAGANGSISASDNYVTSGDSLEPIDSNSIAIGSVVITAYPNSGYIVDHWQTDALDDGRIPVESSFTVSVSFTRDTTLYPIQIRVNPSIAGRVDVIEGSLSMQSLTPISEGGEPDCLIIGATSLQAVSNSGYRFTNWEHPEYTYQGTTYIDANFDQDQTEYNIATSASTGGFIYANGTLKARAGESLYDDPDTGILYVGDHLTLRPIADNGYEFIEWTYPSTMPAQNITISATFERNSDWHQVSAVANPVQGGTIVGNTVLVPEGTNIRVDQDDPTMIYIGEYGSFQAIPDSEGDPPYQFVDWTYPETIEQDTVLRANFEEN